MTDRSQILVTGVPRSGTTWVARLIADAQGMSMPGREPMNPRGRQYALAGTLIRWTRVDRPTDRQTKALRATYGGRSPWAYSRFGRHPLAAFLPGRRVVVKDPFAMLSLPAVCAATGARAVLVYRHPGAVFVSYRRMGWTPDLDELRLSLAEDAWDPGLVARVAPILAGVDESDEVAAATAAWKVLHLLALHDLPTDALVVAHRDLALGGESATRTLFEALGLEVTPAVRREVSRTEVHRASSETGPESGLHVLGRAPSEVADSWRARLPAEVIERMDDDCQEVRELLRRHQLPLGVASTWP